MKAAIVEKPGVLVVKDIPIPNPGKYDALCELLYGTTCTGTDLHIISGNFLWPIKYPTIIGHESIGRVIEIGECVRNYKLGDIVTRAGVLPLFKANINSNWGGFAEFGIARDHWAMREDGIFENKWTDFCCNQIVPTEIDPAEATMIITWRETLSYFLGMGVEQIRSVLIIGSGGNGIAFASHAANLSIHEIIMIGNRNRYQVAQRVGSTDFFDYKINNLTKLIVFKYPKGFDCIIDAIGKKGQIEMYLPLLKKGGTIGIYGLDNYDLFTSSSKNAFGDIVFYDGEYREEETHEKVLNLMKSGFLDAKIWLDLGHPFPLKEIGEAFKAVHERKYVKALIKLKKR